MTATLQMFRIFSSFSVKYIGIHIAKDAKTSKALNQTKVNPAYSVVIPR